MFRVVQQHKRMRPWLCFKTVRYRCQHKRFFGVSPRVLSYPAEGDSESPHPILFIPGPFESSKLWQRTALRFSKMGHETAILESPFKETKDLKDKIAHLHSAVSNLGPLTIMVASSFNGFVAQKYLESWAIAGCVLINSLPPNTTNCLERIFSSDNTPRIDLCSTLTKDVNENEGSMKLFANLIANLNEEEIQQLSDDTVHNHLDWNFLRETLEKPVNLEPGVVPMLIVHGESDGLIHLKDAESTAKFHHGELQTITGATHTFLSFQQSCVEEMESILESWINECF